jgi:hypothetical protein
MNTRLDSQEILVRGRAMRIQAQQTCQRAVQVQQEAARTCTQAQLTVLRGLMPGATTMTCEITMMILGQRGLLGSMTRPKCLARR